MSGNICISVIILLYFGTYISYATNLIPTDTYSHDAAMLPDDMYHLFWKFDEEYITFEVHVKTHGYVGFGVSTNGGMGGADVVIAWIKDEEIYFQDRWAWREFEPDIDDIQDWELLEAHETDTHTVLKFTRPLVTCDKDNDLPITNGTTKIIWSYSDMDPYDEVGLAYHGSDRRGTRSLLLLDRSKQETPPKPDDAINWDLVVDDYIIPEEETTYWCQAFKVPELDVKHHAIQIDPVITEGNEALVHHIVLYECGVDLEEEHESASWNCFDDPMAETSAMEGCEAVLIAWAIGGGPFVFPSVAGLPFGDLSSPKYLRLEMHYNNPSGKRGQHDRSGLRLWLTPTLRQYDAGILTTGVPVEQQPIVPWGYETLVWSGQCSSKCLSEALDNQSEGIYIFSAMLHTHYRGKGVKVRHIRDGKELPPISEDKNYDFNFQEIRLVSPEVQILPTDDIIVECTYFSDDVHHMTYGGPGAQDEMCESFMFYYPKTDLAYCESQTDPVRFGALYGGYIKIEELSFEDEGEQEKFWFVTEPVEYMWTPYFYIFEDAGWEKQETRDNYQSIISEGNTHITCSKILGEYEAHHTLVPLPEIQEEYIEPEPECINGEKYEPKPAPSPKPTPSSVPHIHVSAILTITSVVILYCLLTC